MQATNTPCIDPYNLQRFYHAQSLVYDEVISELAEGYKQTHWIWYIFPQREGLGQSYNSQYYGIKSDDEAKAYLADPVLGKRLRECTQLVRSHLDAGSTLEDIFAEVDALKFCSCMQLFGEVSGEDFFRELA